jgi:hypothetical protein
MIGYLIICDGPGFCEPRFEFEPFITISTVGSVLTSATLRFLMPVLKKTAYISQFQDRNFGFINELQ